MQRWHSVPKPELRNHCFREGCEILKIYYHRLTDEQQQQGFFCVLLRAKQTEGKKYTE